MNDPPDSHQEEARRWLADAFRTLASARHQLTGEDLPEGIACFLAHLAAEKALKAVLIALHHRFQKVHDLVELQRPIVAAGLSMQVTAQDLKRLNPWAIDGRYLEDVPASSPGVAHDLVAIAAGVLTEAEHAIDELARRERELDQFPLAPDEEEQP